MRHALPFALFVLATGCANAPEQLGQTADEVVTVNGTSLNGTSLNGTSLNGTSLNGSSWTGIIPGAPGQPATEIPLRIDSATQGTGANADVWFYEVSYQTTAGWQPLCGADGTTPNRAIAVAGVWQPAPGDGAHYTASPTQFTWACQGHTIAKCVELGYKPWTGYVDHLQACVRLLRGDFCGDGTTYTVDGTNLNLYDDVGVQADTEQWAPEAAWGPRGAVCVNKHNPKRYDAFGHTPRCVKHLREKDCGEEFEDGALLIDELP